MKKALIIVESPAKIKTLRKFLPNNFLFESSVGHIRDLPAKKFGIDIEHDFSPQYEVLADKKEVIDKLKTASKKVDIVYLSCDPDREGEAIAWHIAHILPKTVPYKRVTFNAITKQAVHEALEHPRDIDLHLVDAQQARRLLDRMVGYKISPILQRKIQRGGKDGALSAGRVQSVALKLVVLREREIDVFTPIEYWNLGAILEKRKEKKSFSAHLHTIDGNRVKDKDHYLIRDEITAKTIEKELKNSTFLVEKVDKKEKKRNPPPPFITSTLQQEAARHYGFSATRTMNIAQSLYEGIELGNEGHEGLITYMRTDSTRIAPEALSAARAFITSSYSKEYLPQAPVQFIGKKNAQDAHEAIRPTNPVWTPESIKKHLTTDQYKLYSLVWKRFLACQMNPAIYDTVSADIRASQRLLLRATGSVVKFPGYLTLYQEKEDHEEGDKEGENLLPPLSIGDTLDLQKTFAIQSFTKPPPRFTEASLVKELEKSGIGRPSTYASIMQKIVGRAYTVKEKNTLKPTELGKIIVQMLDENFDSIMDIGFTAKMEDELDKIAETDVDWKEFIAEFWHQFFPKVQKAEKEAHVPKIDTDLNCPDCGSKLQKIWSRNQYFYGCSRYPECKYTAPLEELTLNKEDYAADFDWDQKCGKCGSPMKVRKSRYGIFLGCTQYPTCKTIVNIPKKGEPLPKDLPACPAIGCSGHIVGRKSRFGKTFYACSTYPECNVIVNDLEDLTTKYVDYPRTPYEKKKSAKKTPSSKTKKSPQQLSYTLSKELSSLLGKTTMTRPEVTKALWTYIKKHKLQKADNKRLIVPDAKLTKIFGAADPIDMMKLAGIITPHLKK